MPRQDQFSVRLPMPDRRKLDRLAKEDGRTRSGYVAKLIDRHFAEQETKA